MTRQAAAALLVLLSLWFLPARMARAVYRDPPSEHNLAPAFDHTFQSLATSDGNGTAMSVGGLGSVSVQIPTAGAGSTFGTATVNFEVTVNGTDWIAVKGYPVGTGTAGTTTTVGGAWRFNIGGADQFRARISGSGGGTSLKVSGKGMTSSFSTDTVSIGTGSSTIGNVGLNAGSNAVGTVGINAALPAGSNSIGAVTANAGTGTYATKRIPFAVTASVVRPNNTTAYAAGQAISDSTSSPTLLTFTGCAATPNGSGEIQYLTIVDEANPATPIGVSLYLFQSTVTAQADGAALALSAVESRSFSFGGTLSSGGFFKLGSAQTSFLQTTSPRIFTCTGGTTNLYGILSPTGAYTPVANERFDVTIAGYQN